MKTLFYSAVIFAFVFLVGTSTAKPKRVICKTSSIHMTVSADGKGYIVTSAIVCTNGKIALLGKRG